VIDAEAGQTCTTKEATLTWNQTGPQGPAGSPGLSAVEVVTMTGFTSGIHDVTIPCPAGKTVLSGGWRFNGIPGWMDNVPGILNNHPSDDRSGWQIRVNNNTPATMTLYTVCAITA
jgi:hypothetical protein